MPVTLTPKLEKRVEKALDDAIELADLGDRQLAAHKIARTVYDTEPDLIVAVSETWIMERLTWMITRRRSARRDEKYGRRQMVLADPVFQDLPKTIFLRNGKRPRLMYTVLTESEDHLKLLRERLKNHPRVRQFERVVELHRKWSAVQRGITLEDAMKREAAEREAED